MMRKLISFALVIFTLTVSGACKSREQNRWQSELSALMNEKSYTVRAVTFRAGESEPVEEKTEYYDGKNSHTVTKKDGKTEEYYYSNATGTCRIYVFDEEYDVWISVDTEESELYFYSYEETERLRKIGSWIDSGEIVFDEADGSCKGGELSGGYLYGGKTHNVKEIGITRGVSGEWYLKESFTANEDGVEVSYTSELRFENIGLTRVELPINSIAAEELEDKMEL